VNDAARNALIGALSDLRALENRLDGLHKRLLAVPIDRDSTDPADLGVEVLLLDVGKALHQTILARIQAEYENSRVFRGTDGR
jgi:hypothetical protein